MKAPLLFFLALIMFSSSASAGWLPAPLNILEEKVFDGDWNVSHKEGTPVKDVRASQHIRGWIDIVGFREMCNIDDVDYVNGSPRDFAIVKRDAWHTNVGGKVVSFSSSCVVEDRNGVTTAIQYTSFCWKEKVCKRVCGLVGCHLVCHWKFHHEYQTIAYSVESPNTFNNSIEGYEITITCYNNSVTPYTLIYMPPRQNIIKQSVTYRNDTASWHNLTGLVMKNSRGTESVRFLNKSGFFIDENETITRRAEYFVINEAPLNWSLFGVHTYTPYACYTNVSVCNVTLYNSKPSDFIAVMPIMMLVGILSAFGIGIGITTGRIRV